MLDNKVLINLCVLSLGNTYEVYIPVNEKIGNISKLLNMSLLNVFDKKYTLINVDTGEYYKNNDLVRDTSIKNGSIIMLI